MATGWFLAPYKRRDLDGQIGRYCSMDDYTPLVTTDGGGWAEAECLGNAAVVKVRASAATLTTIAADPGITRIPVALLDDPLSTLTPAQRTALQTRVLALGYTLAELQAQFPGGLTGTTLRQLLRFVLSRRLQSRYDQPTDTIILDGPVQPTLTVEHVDAAVV